MKVKGLLVTILIGVIISTSIPIGIYFLVKAPADAEYNRKFYAHVDMAYEQSTLDKMKDEFLAVWRSMNDTFRGYDFTTTYSTWWYADQHYENSLAAEEQYFIGLNQRFNDQIKDANAILAGNKTVLQPYNQWYQQALEDMRGEMKREGGLDWVISGAWYLHMRPMAYWSDAIIIWAILALWGLIALVVIFGVEWSEIEW